MMYTCISLIVHPPFEIPGSAPGQARRQAGGQVGRRNLATISRSCNYTSKADENLVVYNNFNFTSNAYFQCLYTFLGLIMLYT